MRRLPHPVKLSDPMNHEKFLKKIHILAKKSFRILDKNRCPEYSISQGK